MRMRSLFTLLAATLAGLACGTSVAGPGETVVIEPIQVESVEVHVGSTQPAAVTARVKGTLGNDSCNYLHTIAQRRDGNAVSIDIQRSRVTGAVCLAVVKEFQEDLGLAGAFAAGDYTLRVNGVTRPFSVR